MKKTGGPCAPPPPRPGLGLATRLRAVLASPVSPSFRPRRPSLLAAPAWLSSWPARLCPQAWGQPCPLDASAPASNPRNGVGRPQQPGPRDLGQAPPFAQHILLVASSLRSPRARVTVQLPAPRYWDLSLGLSHPPPTAATGEHCQAQAQAQGGNGALPTRWTLLSSIYMFLLPPPMVAAKTQGPGRKLCPKSPRKYQHQSLGRWNLLTKPVMAQPAPDLPPPWQTGWGQQVALCCLQSLGTAGALSDLQITLSPVHSTQQSLSQQASDYKLNRHALVHLQCG